MKSLAPRSPRIAVLLIPLAAAGIFSPWGATPAAAGPYGRALRAERRAARLSIAAPVPRVIVPLGPVPVPGPGPVIVAAPFPVFPGGFAPWFVPPAFVIAEPQPAAASPAVPAPAPAPAPADAPAAAAPAVKDQAATATAAKPARPLDPDPAAAPANAVAPDGTRSVLVTGGEPKPAPGGPSAPTVTQPPVELLPTPPAE